MRDNIELLLSGRYRELSTGDPIGVSTRSVAIERTLAGAERELVDALGLGFRIAVISDVTTHAVLGDRVERALAGRYEIQSIVLPSAPHPDLATVDLVRRATQRADSLIAIGSGSINDISKYASAQDNKPYVVFGTAPSMNGYTSLSASITVHGHKLSLPAQAPLGAFFDLNVLAAAPLRLIQSGLGDSICRTTAQADWLLANELFGTPYRELPFDLLKDDEPELLAHASDLARGDLAVMERLVRTLVLSGFGTAIVGSSQPASQGEHLISHYIDMLAAPGRPLVYHGEQVGVTTMSMVQLQERMLETTPMVHPDSESLASLTARFGEELGTSCWADFEQKRIDQVRSDDLNHKLESSWDGIAQRIAEILLPSSQIRDVLLAAEAKIAPEEIFLGRDFYQQALLHSREIRNRYTFLDLAANARRLGDIVTQI